MFFKKRYNYNVFAPEQRVGVWVHLEELPELKKFSNDELADLVLKDVFGKGGVRRLMLGERWESVQKLVNKKVERLDA